MTLTYLGSVLMSVTPETTKDHVDASSLAVAWGHVSIPWPCWPEWLALPLGPWGHLAQATSRTMTGSVLMSVAQIVTKGLIDAWDLDHKLWL